MEEQQIFEFVHRVSTDENLRKELESNPEGIIMREGFSPRVLRVITKLVPHLSFQEFLDTPDSWWSGL